MANGDWTNLDRKALRVSRPGQRVARKYFTLSEMFFRKSLIETESCQTQAAFSERTTQEFTTNRGGYEVKMQNMGLLTLALAMLILMAACNKTDPSSITNVNSSPGKNSNSSSGTSPTSSNRFVGTWIEEDQKSDQGSRFTEDGKVIEVSTGKQVATYSVSGDDKATISIAEGGTHSATLESNTRMKMVVGTETVYLRKK